MKKYIALSLAVALAGGFCSCSNEEDDIFDTSSAIRLENAKTEYAKILADQGGKWLMEYFTSTSEPGYQFVMTFNSDQTVTVSANNYWTNNEFATDESLWAVIADNGPVLTFNTFNKVLHIFSVPDDIDNPDSPDTSENGTGHGGDYEFSFIEFYNDNNSIRLKGKKTGLYIIMHRLPAETNDEEYLEGIHTAINNMFNSKFTPLYLTDESNGEEFEMTFESVLTGLFGFRPAGENEYFSETHSSIVSENGIRFLEEVAVVRHEGTDSIHFQNFSLQEDGSLLSTDNGNSYRITAGGMKNVFVASETTWRFDPDSISGTILSTYEKMKADILTYRKNETLQYIDFKYSADDKYITMTSKTRRYTFKLYLNVEATNDTVKLSFNNEGDTNGLAFYRNAEGLQDFVSLLTSTQWQGNLTNVLAPDHITFTSNDLSFVVNLR